MKIKQKDKQTEELNCSCIKEVEKETLNKANNTDQLLL